MCNFFLAVIQENGKPYGKEPTFRSWLLRQVHVIHTGIAFKFWRMLKFLPDSQHVYELLSTWTESGPWQRRLKGLIKCRPDAEGPYLNGRLKTMVSMFEMAFEILSVFARAAEADLWGIDVEPHETGAECHRGTQGIVRLLQIMTCLSKLDRFIRIKVKIKKCIYLFGLYKIFLFFDDLIIFFFCL